jgi:hypothetical protein
MRSHDCLTRMRSRSNGSVRRPVGQPLSPTPMISCYGLGEVQPVIQVGSAAAVQLLHCECTLVQPLLSMAAWLAEAIEAGRNAQRPMKVDGVCRQSSSHRVSVRDLLQQAVLTSQ